MKISVLPGDGIGPEIVNQAIKILEFFKLDKDLLPLGMYYLEIE